MDAFTLLPKILFLAFSIDAEWSKLRNTGMILFSLIISDF